MGKYEGRYPINRLLSKHFVPESASSQSDYLGMPLEPREETSLIEQRESKQCASTSYRDLKFLLILIAHLADIDGNAILRANQKISFLRRNSMHF